MTNAKTINPRTLSFSNPITSFFPFDEFISMDFTNTVLRFYPLAADMSKLQKYCDNYLNFNSETKTTLPVYFKAAAPYVLLELNEYPQMTLHDVGTWLQTREPIIRNSNRMVLG